MKGHKLPPSTVPAAPFLIAPPITNLGTSMGNRPLLSAPTLLTGAESVLHICAQPEFSGHSPEVSCWTWRLSVSTKANEKLFYHSRSRRIGCFASPNRNSGSRISKRGGKSIRRKSPARRALGSRLWRRPCCLVGSVGARFHVHHLCGCSDIAQGFLVLVRA